MRELPIWRMIGLGLACAFASCAASFAVCIVTNANYAASLLAMVLVLVVSVFFAMRWWLRVCRAAGIDTTVKMTSQRSLLGAAFAAVLLVGSIANFFAYVSFHDRIVQLAIALTIAVPAAFWLGRIGYAMQSDPRANEAQLLRSSTYVTLASAVLLGANLIMQLSSRAYHDLTGTRDLFIAFGLMVVPMMTIQSSFTWRRYQRAQKDMTLAHP